MSVNRTKTRIGRNDPCPCKSGKKYKRCHGAPNGAPPATAGAIDAQLRAVLAKPTCLAPDHIRHECSRGTINAHTVSRSGSLAAIVRDGHVYSYGLTVQGLVAAGGDILPKLTGWKKASTFPGFCGHHDKQLFAPLEDVPFTGTKEQCFLLGYRAVVRELYTKQSSYSQGSYRVAQAVGTGNPFVIEVTELMNQGVELGLRDARAHKARYDRVWSSSDWANFHGLLIEFDGVFPIQCAGGIFPERDICGVEVQRLGVGRPAPSAVTIVSFAVDTRSFVLLSWLTDSDAVARKFADAIVNFPVGDLPWALAALILQASENCHFSPDWYEGLPDEGIQWCAMQARYGADPEAVAEPPAKTDGARFLGQIKATKVAFI